MSLLCGTVPAQPSCGSWKHLRQLQSSRCALAAPFPLQAGLVTSRKIFHPGFVGYLELRESWARGAKYKIRFEMQINESKLVIRAESG